MKETKLNKDQIPINFSFIADKSFDNFFIGKNSIAIELLKDLTISDRTNIVFIRGNNSSGKTHLCLAVNNSTDKNIFILNRKNISSVSFQDILKYDSLIIDDIDFLIANVAHEENIFVLINEFIHSTSIYVYSFIQYSMNNLNK